MSNVSTVWEYPAIDNNLIPAGVRVVFVAIDYSRKTEQRISVLNEGKEVAFLTPQDPQAPSSFPITGASVFKQGLGWFIMPQGNIELAFAHSSNGEAWEQSNSVLVSNTDLADPSTGKAIGRALCFLVRDGNGGSVNTMFTLSYIVTTDPCPLSYTIDNSVIPAGARVVFTAFHQSDERQKITVTDGNNQALSFYTPDNPNNALASFPIQGAGSSFAQFSSGTGWFAMPNGEITITSATMQGQDWSPSSLAVMGPSKLVNPDTKEVWGGSCSFGMGANFIAARFTLLWWNGGG